MKKRPNVCHRQRRRGAVAVFLAISLVVLLGMAALAVDASMMYTAKAELQRTADAAALAGTWALLDDRRIIGDQSAFTNARYDASAYGGLNSIMAQELDIDENSGNASDGDIVIGFLADPDDGVQSLSFLDPAQFNSVQVRARKDDERNGSLSLSFARMFGHSSRDGFAQATATYRGDVRGYKINSRSGNAQLLPIALHVNVWNNLLAGTQTTGDIYTYDPDSGAVSNGGDGVLELNLYPGAGTGQLPPGNFGTVDIGSENNSTADISRQIRYGVNESDLAYFGGQLDLNATGYIMLNGDTGLSAAIKDDLEAIKGQPRAIPLFDQVSGPGNNSYYRVVGFGGIRIMYVKLTGAMSGKKVIIQPAFVVDGSVLPGGPSTSTYVYTPPMLTR